MFWLITLKTHRQIMEKTLKEALEAYRSGVYKIIEAELGKLKKDRDHWKDEAGIWKNLYEELLHHPRG